MTLFIKRVRLALSIWRHPWHRPDAKTSIPRQYQMEHIKWRTAWSVACNYYTSE